MSRGAGTGFIALGLIALVVGAVMRFAISVHPHGFNVHTAGLIVLIVGAVALLVGLLMLILGGRSRTTTRENVVSTPSGQERVEQRDDWAG